MNTNYYEIKLPGYDDTNLYNIDYAEEFIKNILKKYIKSNTIKGIINVDIYLNKTYGIIINIFNENKDYIYNSNAKIIFHVDSKFLYQIDYFDIPNHIKKKGKIYYYKKNIYLLLEKDINIKEYINILEFGNIIYGNNSLEIINKGIKL